MLILLAAALLAQQPSTVANEAGARVSGRVVSTYPAGVSDVTLILARVDGRSAEQRMTTSDADGRFTFERISAGRYEITATKAGYTSRRLGETEPRFEAGVSVTLRDGQQAANVEIPLRRSASIAGRVIRSDGAAAPGIQVVLAQRQGRSVVPLGETQTTTAWDGRYTMTGLPPGTYLVLASGVDRSRATGSLQAGTPEQAAFEINLTRAEDFTPTLYPGVPATETSATVTLLEGVVADAIDIWLAPARRFSISGRVTWPQDVTIGDITIEYGSPSDRQASIWTVSDPGGLFSIDAVAPGTVVLLATANSNRGRLMGIVSTDVRADDVEDLAVTLLSPGSVEGRVMFPADLPQSARPGAIALIPKLLNVSPLYSAPEAPLSPDGRFTLTNALGEYEFAIPGLPGGFRIVSVSRSGIALPSGRIGVGTGDRVAGLQVSVAK